MNFTFPCSGILGEPGSSLFMFEHKGIIQVQKEELSKSQMSDPLELAIEIGAEDVLESLGEAEEEICQFKCEPSDLKMVSDALRKRGLAISSATLEYIPKSYVSLDSNAYEKATRLVDHLSEDSDVMDIHSNFLLKDDS